MKITSIHTYIYIGCVEEGVEGDILITIMSDEKPFKSFVLLFFNIFIYQKHKHNDLRLGFVHIHISLSSSYSQPICVAHTHMKMW